jgi:SAM-dependent methyltransferase
VKLHRRRTGPARAAGRGASGSSPAAPASTATSLDQFARRAADEARATRIAVLDVGTGKGSYGRYFEPDRYHSIQLRPPGPGATQIGCRPRFAFDELPVDDELFGLVLCTGVVERTPEPEGVLTELNRVLAPRGRLFLTAPLIVPERLSGHLARLPRYGLNYLLEASGFTIEELQQMPPARAYAVVARKTRRPGHCR